MTDKTSLGERNPMGPKFLTGILILVLSTISSFSWADKLALADEKFAAKDFEAASNIYATLLDNSPNDSELSYLLARSYRMQGRNDKANDVLEDSLEEHPDDVNNLYLVGTVKMDLINDASVFKKLGLAKSGLKAWQRAVELDPNHHEARYGICTYLIVAPGIAGGDLKKAKLEIDALRKVSPEWADLVLASLKEKQEDYSEAQLLLTSAADKIKDRAFPHFLLADFFVKQQQFNQAAEALATYKNRDQTWNDPGKLGIAIMSGRIAAGQGKQTIAIQHFDLALEQAKSKSTRGYIRKLKQKLKDA